MKPLRPQAAVPPARRAVDAPPRPASATQGQAVAVAQGRISHVLTPETITNHDDPRTADYRALTDVELRTRWEPPNGLFIGEGELVIRRALRAGYRLRSVLIDAKRVSQIDDLP